MIKNTCNKKVLFSIISILLFSTCSSPENVSKSKFVVAINGLIPPGHEVLTAVAINNANRILGQNFYPNVDTAMNPVVKSGYENKNPIIRGNFLVDMPLDRQAQEFNLPLFKGLSLTTISDWHDNDNAQHFHFLRRNNPLQSSVDACKEAVKELNYMSTSAQKYYVSDRNKALNMIGGMTHMLQDSYSSAHAKRVNDGDWHLIEVCNWGKVKTGVCNHGFSDVVIHDTVFDYQTGNEAEAVKATTDYLINMAKVLNGSVSLNSALQIFSKKYLDCTQIH